MEKSKQSIAEIKRLEQYLSDKSREDIEKIFAYGEEMKAEGEMKKKEFWRKEEIIENAKEFWKLLRYKRKHEDEMIHNYKYLNSMTHLEREKFIEQYLDDYILYSGKPGEEEENVFEKTSRTYSDRKDGNVVVEEGTSLGFQRSDLGVEGAKYLANNLKLKRNVFLRLDGNNLGDEGAEEIAKLELKEGMFLLLNYNQIGIRGINAISKMILKEGINLDLGENNFGDIGAIAIAQNMKLKKGVGLNLHKCGIGAEGAKAIAREMKLQDRVTLTLSDNDIGDKGIEALSKMRMNVGVILNLNDNNITDKGAKILSENLKLEEGMELVLSGNKIGDKGAKAIMENLKLKNGVILSLSNNKISTQMKNMLKEWVEENKRNGINCEIYV